MLVADADVSELIESVWSAMLGFPVEPTAAPIAPGGSGLFYVGTVQITGDLDAAVLVEMPETLARSMAAAMFGLSPAELGDDEVCDVVGELANMLAGNLKGLVEGPTSLSLPTVSAGADYRVRVPGDAFERTYDYCCAQEPLRIRLITRSEPGAGTTRTSG